MSARGSVTLWVLGLVIGLMFLGGFAVDLWHAVAVRRELSAMADAAALAGANGVDESELRAGRLVIDPERAHALVDDAIVAQSRADPLDGERVEVAGNDVTVTLRDHVDFSLLSIFLGGQHFDVEVHATARPQERR
ncbi:MAG TPA: pilus assembly protein TadG-related protein [Acidimicrobiia bacterium]|nr:pilus assembly protein TadG-related protein [Acidimicrobiia bacterium]